MARRIVSVTTITPTVTPDASNLVDQQYPWIIQGGSTTQIVYIHEISISGQAASSSSPTFMILGRDSTVAASLGSNITGFSDTGMDANTTALVTGSTTVVGDAFTTKPVRSASLHLMNCSLNAFGGVYFWRANKIDECPRLFSGAANVGEASLSAFTGGTPGAIGCHMIYEAL